jgi:anthranilate synthase component I
MYHPSLEEVKKLARHGNRVPLWRELVADLETPVSCFLKIQRGGPSFLLESVEGGAHEARYSFIGTEPTRLLRLTEESGDPMRQVAQALAEYRVAQVTGLPRFAGGAVGYLAYEAAACFEDLPVPGSDPLGLPLACFMLADTLLIFDHVTHCLVLCFKGYLMISEARPVKIGQRVPGRCTLCWEAESCPVCESACRTSQRPDLGNWGVN